MGGRSPANCVRIPVQKEIPKVSQPNCQADRAGADNLSGSCRAFCAAVAFVFVVTGVSGWVASRDVRELAGQQVAAPVATIGVVSQALATLPDLPAERAILVPGLEDVHDAYSPVLSADLNTIVFAHLADFATGYDLYLATRQNVDEPFGTPRLIEGCQSPECDAYPTLSPDLLELLFVRSDDNPRLMRSVRRSVNDEFGAAEVCAELCEDGITTPQLIGSDMLFFGCLCEPPQKRSLWMARREGAEDFKISGPVVTTHPLALVFLSSDQLRAYSGGDLGIHITVRQSPRHSFGHNVVWGDSMTTGLIDGPLWIAPQEDVAVYCSAGPGKKWGEARQLWVWRKGANGESISASRH